MPHPDGQKQDYHKKKKSEAGNLEDSENSLGTLLELSWKRQGFRYGRSRLPSSIRHRLIAGI
jgi:hypothetical protein